MKKNKMNLIFSLCLAVVVAFMTGCSSNNYAYDGWDNDGNAYLDNTEFESAVAEIGYYNSWDIDDDNYLTEDEWNDGINEYLDGYDYSEYGVFSDWDADANGMLDNNEFYDGLYGVVDQNDNDLIEENEYDTWYDDDFGV